MKHDIMTIKEVAEYIRVSQRTVNDWAQKSEIPCGKLGNVWRFKRSEIEQWVDDKLSQKKSFAPPKISMEEAFQPDRIIVTNASSKSEALNKLIDKLVESGQIKRREELADAIFRRESLMSTGIGNGIAVPHVRLSSIDNIVAAAAISKKEIEDYDSIDGKPVQIILMIATGKNQHAEYLSLLSNLSKKLKDEKIRQQILNETCNKNIYKVLTN